MDEAMSSRYWCYRCSRIVYLNMELEIKCPHCDTDFVEELRTARREIEVPDSDTGSDRALSLWTPILLGMVGNTRRRRRMRHFDFSDEDDDREDYGFRRGGETEIDREIESIARRRRRSSATVIQLLQGIRAGIASEYGSSEADRDEDDDGNRDTEGDGNREQGRGWGRGRERFILINPATQTLIIRNSSPDPDLNQNIIGSLGDYFMGSNLDLLLQHLAENDPNRYGTPPARKEAIEAMPTVNIEEKLQCSVCLDDFQIGEEAKEMPCRHKFHCKCILPWLELHSSCPICRLQLPADESKVHSDGPVEQNNPREQDNAGGSNSSQDQGRTVDGGNGSGRRFSFPWPLSGLFSSSSPQSQSEGANSSSASSSANTNENTSQRDLN